MLKKLGRVQSLALIAVTALFVVPTIFAQTTTTQPAQQTTTTTTTPAKKPSFWDRVKAASQNANQQVQNGQNAVQNGTQNVQNGVSNVSNSAVQQAGSVVPTSVNTPCGSLGSANGGTLQQASFTGGGGGNSCGNRPRCYDAGPFAAQVTQMTASQQGWYHVVRMEVQFHNSTNQPLIIAYHDGTSTMVDNLGNTYGGAGGSTGPVQGMGIDRGNSTDSQFVLAPGQTSSASFNVARSRNPNTDPLGTGFTYNLTIDQLQPQNGAQALMQRQYNLNFPSLALNSAITGGNSLANGTTPAAPATKTTATTTTAAKTPATATTTTTASTTAAKTVTPAAKKVVVITPAKK